MQLGTQVDLRQAKQMGIVQQVLGQLIDNSIIDQEAQRMQLDVSDAVIRDMITRDPMFRGADGGFDRNAFEALLAANHMTEAQYVERIRHDIPRDDLLLAITAGVAAPQAIVDRLYRYRNEKRVADIVALPISSAGDVGQPSDAELTKFYDAHQDMFRAPEYRGFTMASLTPADLAPKDRDSRGQAEKRLRPAAGRVRLARASRRAANPRSFRRARPRPPRRRLPRARIGPTSREPSPVRTHRRSISVLVKPRGIAANSWPMSPSACRSTNRAQPIKSTLGWHILRVVKIVPPTTQSFDEVKAKLQADLAHSEAVDRLYTIANHVDDAIAGGATLDEAAAKFGLKKTVINAVDDKGLGRDGKQVQLPVSPADVLKLAFATDEGRTSRVTQTSDGAIFVLHMDKIVPPSVRPLAEVKDKAVAAWQDEQAQGHGGERGEALAAEVKPGMQLSARRRGARG